MITASEEARIEMIQAEDDLIDDEFFGIFTRLLESAVVSREQTTATQLKNLQDALLTHSSRGKLLQQEAEEVQIAMEEIQEMGEDITREKLLDLLVNSPTDTRIRAYVRLVRPALDYTFFQMLSERVDSARGKNQSRLADIREKLLAYTQEVDTEISNRSAIAQQNLEAVLQSDDIDETLRQNIEAVDEFFLQAVNQALEEARKSGDLEHSARLQQVVDVLDKLSAPPAELELIEKLLQDAADEKALRAAVEAHSESVTPELVQMLTSLVTQTQASVEQLTGPEKEKQSRLLFQLQAIHQAVLGFSMRRSFKQS
jgi:hypothetical protein